MAIGYGFNRRIAGNIFTKATGIQVTDIKMGGDYDYAEIGGKVTHKGEGFLVIEPTTPITATGRLFIEINPEVFQFGLYNHQAIVEPGDKVLLLLDGGDRKVEKLEWIFRIYVAR